MQQCLPFTVLKHGHDDIAMDQVRKLQQCLPFTVLKRGTALNPLKSVTVATVLTVYGIETLRVDVDL